jgi:hypothetical protein
MEVPIIIHQMIVAVQSVHFPSNHVHHAHYGHLDYYGLLVITRITTRGNKCRALTRPVSTSKRVALKSIINLMKRGKVKATQELCTDQAHTRTSNH